MLLSSEGGETRQEEKESEKSKRKEERERTSNLRDTKRKEYKKHSLTAAKTSTSQETRDKEGIGKRKERRPRQKKFLNALVWRAGARNRKTRWGKKVRRSGQEALKTEKQHFDWTFPNGGPEKGDFFPFFAVLDPPKPRPPTKSLQENGVF